MAENLFWAICRKIQRAGRSSWSTCPRSSKASTRCSRTRTSATSRCSSRCPTAGRSSSCSRSCRSIGSTSGRRGTPCSATSPATRDGKIDQFIDRRDVKKTLPLHPFNGEPYYLGAFLVGAYQEILGDLHNLFGDTNAVHVSLDDETANVRARARSSRATRSARCSTTSSSTPKRCWSKLRPRRRSRRQCRPHGRSAGRPPAEFYEEGLQGYTYLEDPNAD